MYILFYFSRNHLFKKDDINYHEYFSEDLCGHRRSILVEIPSRRVVVRVDQHYQHVEVGFEGAYAIVKEDIASGKFSSVNICAYFGMSGNISYLSVFLELDQ